MASKETYVNYEEFYHRRNDVTSENYSKRCRSFDKKLAPLLPADKKIAMLDIGCGCGFLVYYLRSIGFDNVTGIDINEQLIQTAKHNVDAEFISCDATDYLRETQKRFDIIFMWNVLEHIPHEEVIDFLATVRQSLTEHGFAVVRTPNMTNIMAQGHLNDDFTHVTGLTEQSLEQIASISGFSVVEHLNQFRVQNFKGKVKAVLNWSIHKFLLWLRGGTKPKVYYRNLYAILQKQ